MDDFGSQVAAWAEKAKARAKFIARDAAKEVAAFSNHAKPEGKMPVYSGFLQASQNVGFGTMPSGPSLGPLLNGTNGFTWRDPIGDPSVVPAKIDAWDLSTTLFVGWTAEYAWIQDQHNGFVYNGTSDWQRFVTFAITKAKDMIP